jgi:hypothetical protein
MKPSSFRIDSRLLASAIRSDERLKQRVDWVTSASSLRRRPARSIDAEIFRFRRA